MLAPETVLQNRYPIIRLPGQGGMGAVYEAMDERLDMTVALKETLFADERLRKRFHTQDPQIIHRDIKPQNLKL